jgi:ankyrin repeat protein
MGIEIGIGIVFQHLAIESGNVELVKLVLEKGGLPLLEICNLNGENPLAFAASKNFTDICKVLISRGTSHSTPNRLGKTALHFGSSYSSIEVGKIDFCFFFFFSCDFWK